MSNKEAINKLADHNNYLHVDFKEIPIENTDILRWQDGRKWMVVVNGEEVEFQPLYHLVYPEESSSLIYPDKSTFCTGDGKYEDSKAETIKEELKDLNEHMDSAAYDAEMLGCITASAIAEEDRKLDSVIRTIMDECVKFAKKCETEARVVIDLGGTSNYLANAKARRIVDILARRGFDVSYHNGSGDYEYDRHVFNIKWNTKEGLQPINRTYSLTFSDKPGILVKNNEQH